MAVTAPDAMGVNNSESDQARTLLSLPDDELLYILKFLTDPKDIVAVELACKRMLDLVESRRLWPELCKRVQPDLYFGDIRAVEDDDRDAPWWPTNQRSYFKKLVARLTSKSRYPSLTLIEHAFMASSTDQPEENVHKTLHPHCKSRRFPTSYWCTAGTADPTSGDSAAFRLCHPLCRVDELQVRFFKAWFQPGKPLYAATHVRISLGGMPLKYPKRANDNYPVDAPLETCLGNIRQDIDEAVESMNNPQSALYGKSPEGHDIAWKKWQWTSEWFPVKQTDELQRFKIPNKLCYGGYVRLDFKGRTAQQDTDNLFYTCVAYVKLLGTPIFDFHPTIYYPSMGVQHTLEFTTFKEHNVKNHAEVWIERIFFYRVFAEYPVPLPLLVVRGGSRLTLSEMNAILPYQELQNMAAPFRAKLARDAGEECTAAKEIGLSTITDQDVEVEKDPDGISGLAYESDAESEGFVEDPDMWAIVPAAAAAGSDQEEEDDDEEEFVEADVTDDE